MSQDQENIAESVRSGRYFAQSREWYKAMFLAPVGERTLFLVIAVLAAFVGLMALLSLSFLLPVESRVPFNIAIAERADEVLPNLVKLREPKGDLNEALADYFVRQYVVAREMYTSRSLKLYSSFVRAQSSALVFESYKRIMQPDNPTSPIVVFGKEGERQIMVTGASVSREGEKGKAVVQFVDQTKKDGKTATARWTAKMEFTYIDVAVEEKKDASERDSTLSITDPRFQVTGYEVQRDQ